MESWPYRRDSFLLVIARRWKYILGGCPRPRGSRTEPSQMSHVYLCGERSESLMTFQHDPNRRLSRDTLLQWIKSVFYQLLAGLEGSTRRRVQMLAARASVPQHKQMLLKIGEARGSMARDREEPLANKDRIEIRESASSNETEHV
jgi:hypothetical protein